MKLTLFVPPSKPKDLFASPKKYSGFLRVKSGIAGVLATRTTTPKKEGEDVSSCEGTAIQRSRLETGPKVRCAIAGTIRRRQWRTESRHAVFRTGVLVPAALSRQVRHADGHSHRRIQSPGNRGRHDPDADGPGAR